MTEREMPQPGQAAPEIALPDDTGRLRQLSQERGKWLVIYFYPKDDTPGCTVEACEFRDADGKFRELGAEVWGVSILGSASKQAFKQKFGLPFALLADEQHRAAQDYGTWIEKESNGRRYWGVQRATFLVDPEGLIVRVWPKVKPQGHAAEVLTALAQAQAERAGVPAVGEQQ